MAGKFTWHHKLGPKWACYWKRKERKQLNEEKRTSLNIMVLAFNTG